MNKFSFVVALFVISLSSCKKTPILVSQNLESDTSVTCEIDNIDFTYLNLKGKINYKDEKSEHKTNINIRIKKDSIVWVSINAAAGFEAFRIVLKSDSIHILDKINNTYSARDYQSLSSSMGVPLSFPILQSLILGNIIIPREEEDITVQTDSTHCSIKQYRGNVQFINMVNAAMRKVERVQITDGTNTLLINYQKFTPLGSFTFSTENDIRLTIKNQDNKLEVSSIYIEYNKIEFPEKDLNFPFNVPNRFEHR